MFALYCAERTFSIRNACCFFNELQKCPQLQDPVRVLWAEVAVPDMCRVYVVQVHCKHTNGTGYWSDWSESVYSTPQNSRGKTCYRNSSGGSLDF